MWRRDAFLRPASAPHSPAYFATIALCFFSRSMVSCRGKALTMCPFPVKSCALSIELRREPLDRPILHIRIHSGERSPQNRNHRKTQQASFRTRRPSRDPSRSMKRRTQ